MHFNHMELAHNDTIKEMSNGEQDKVKIRYGVISLDDMLRDLQHWETLMASSFMQRPHEILQDGGSNLDEIRQKQEVNLTSALAYAALTTPNGATESELYENIVEIPHY